MKTMSSIYLSQIFGFNSLSFRSFSSYLLMNRFAYVGATRVPIAVPLTCRKFSPLNWKLLLVRDWSLITGRGGLQNGKIASPKLFAPPPPQDRVKLFAPPLLKSGNFSCPSYNMAKTSSNPLPVISDQSLSTISNNPNRLWFVGFSVLLVLSLTYDSLSFTRRLRKWSTNAEIFSVGQL